MAKALRRSRPRRRIEFPAFDLATLGADTLLTAKEVSRLIRFAIPTLELWRRDPHHPLKWVRLNGWPRYRVADVRAWLAGDQQSNDPARPAMRGRPRLKKQQARARAGEARLGADG